MGGGTIHTCVCMYIYIYLFIYLLIHLYIYVCIYIYRQATVLGTLEGPAHGTYPHWTSGSETNPQLPASLKSTNGCFHTLEVIFVGILAI